MSGFTPKQIAEQKLKAFSIGAMGKTTKLSRYRYRTWLQSVVGSDTDPNPKHLARFVAYAMQIEIQIFVLPYNFKILAKPFFLLYPNKEECICDMP
jgi:hypothetical protein